MPFGAAAAGHAAARLWRRRWTRSQRLSPAGWRVRWFRWLDACVAWAGLWCLGGAVLGRGLPGPAAGLALLLVGLGLWVRPLRTRWRPLSGWVGLVMSRGLHPG